MSKKCHLRFTKALGKAVYRKLCPVSCFCEPEISLRDIATFYSVIATKVTTLIFLSSAHHYCNVLNSPSSIAHLKVISSSLSFCISSSFSRTASWCELLHQKECMHSAHYYYTLGCSQPTALMNGPPIFWIEPSISSVHVL